jgi:hypothetical protein
MPRIFSVAAAFLVVALGVGWLASWDNPAASAALARMRDQVAKSRTVVYQTRIKIGSLPERRNKTMIWEPDLAREEMVEGDHLTILIHNGKQRKSLMLLPASKKARLRDISEESQLKSVVELIREVRESSAVLLGKEQINGEETLKYRCDHPTGHYLLWIAADTDLPMKVVVSESQEHEKSHVAITMTDFKWNGPLDESLFSLEVPAGYVLEEEHLAETVLDPKNFIIVLKAYARLNGSVFPDEFNALTPGSMIQFLDDPTLPDDQRMANYRRKLAEAVERPELANLTDEEWKKHGSEIGRTFAQGAVFVQAVSLTNDWHYTGKGVKLGEADKIVAWWAPKDGDEESKTAAVLFGDLHIETKPTESLPAGN